MGAATDRTYAPGRNVTVPFGAGSPGTAYTPSALEKAAIPTSGVHRQPTLLAGGAAGDSSCTVDAQRVPGGGRLAAESLRSPLEHPLLADAVPLGSWDGTRTSKQKQQPKYWLDQ